VLFIWRPAGPEDDYVPGGIAVVLSRRQQFVLVADMSGGLETYGHHELVQIVNDTLIETVEL
jgi:hypothetical protein